MKIIKAPERLSPYSGFNIFLAGSIEMGKAINWQELVTDSLKDKDVTVMNPRRGDWDSSWVQSIDNPKFKQQVDWELDRMQDAHVIAMYFDKDTKSPITLLELGLIAGSHPNKLVVYCPEGFWRKGNVDIVCRRYKVVNCNSFVDFISEIRYRIGGD